MVDVLWLQIAGSVAGGVVGGFSGCVANTIHAILHLPEIEIEPPLAEVHADIMVDDEQPQSRWGGLGSPPPD